MTPYDALLVGAVLGGYLIVALTGAILAFALIDHAQTKRARSRAGRTSCCPDTSSLDAHDPRVGTRVARSTAPGSDPDPGAVIFRGPLEDWQRVDR